MNTLKTFTLALMLTIFLVTRLLATEMSFEQFANEFFTAIQVQDSQKITQLLKEHPNTAEQFQQRLTILGKGTEKRAKQYRDLAALLVKFRQALDDSPRLVLNRLQEEGKKAYYVADYPTAFMIFMSHVLVTFLKECGWKLKTRIYLLMWCWNQNDVY